MKWDKEKALFVFYLRYSPTIGAAFYIVHYAMLVFGVRSVLSDFVIDLSLLAYIFLMIASELFGFCRLHRAFITYIFVSSLDIDLHHWGAGLPVSPELVPLAMVCVGVTLFVQLARLMIICPSKRTKALQR